jgi:subtilase family serine protease
MGTFAGSSHAAPGESGRPNLAPTPITVAESDVLVGQEVHFDAGVRNAGNADSGTFNVKWLVDGADVGAYGSHAGVPSGDTILDGNSQFSHTFDREGSHTVSFVVDVDDHIAELGEEDNTDDITSLGPGRGRHPAR